jgi:hypothetical protein
MLARLLFSLMMLSVASIKGHFISIGHSRSKQQLHLQSSSSSAEIYRRWLAPPPHVASRIHTAVVASSSQMSQSLSRSRPKGGTFG